MPLLLHLWMAKESGNSLGGQKIQKKFQGGKKSKLYIPLVWLNDSTAVESLGLAGNCELALVLNYTVSRGGEKGQYPPLLTLAPPLELKTMSPLCLVTRELLVP